MPLRIAAIRPRAFSLGGNSRRNGRGHRHSNYRTSSSSSSSGSSRWSFWDWYSQRLDTYPLLTKGVTSGLLVGAGDFICQTILAKSKFDDVDDGSHPSSVSSTRTSLWGHFFVDCWDTLRTARFCILGTFWVAPMTHVWYRALSTQIVTGASSPIKVTQRVIVDQFGFAPLFTTSFVGLLWLLEGRSSIEIQTQLKTAIPEIIVAGWSLWIPAMTLNFSVVPIKYQVLYSNVVALVWNVYLSYKSSIAHIKQKDNGGTDDRTDTTDNKREQSR
jgi:hypothetical protein